MTVNQIFNQFLLLGTVALGLVGCTGEKPFSDTSKTEEPDSFGKISISVKTPLSEKYLVTKAVGDKIAAEPDEAKVNSLKVYLFTKDGANGTEDDYVLYKDYDFDSSKIKNVAGNSQVSIAIEPDLMGKTVKAVIIANDSPVLTLTPRSTKLTEFRKALASANVTTRSESDALVGGANKSFPMSCVTGDIKTTPKGNSVDATLVRSMARIDILNFAKDLYITSVKLTNVNNKSYLLGQADAKALNIPSPGVRTKIELKPLTEYSAKLTGAGFGYDATHDTEGTEAIRKANKHRVFYLYEQEVKDKATSPVVEIEYTAKNAKVTKKGKLTVKFCKTTDPKDWVNVKRNHIYTIQLGEEGKSVLQGGIKVRFVVDDWNVVTVPSAIDPNVAVGDFMLSNGHTIKPADLIAYNQKDVIGVVAYLYKSENNARLREGVKNVLKAKGVAVPHGLVMALKNAPTSVIWRTKNTAVQTSFPSSLKDMYDNEVDGYTLTRGIKDHYSLDDFPAFKAALEYAAPTFNESTGWYLPSMSEWMDMLGDNGLKALPNGKFDEAKNMADSKDINLGNIAQTVADNLNAKFDKVGGTNFDAFDINQFYWTASECSNMRVYYVGFFDVGTFIFNAFAYHNGCYIRPILAF